MVLKRYTYRAYPTAGQRRALARTFGSVRVVFNDYITERERLRQAGVKEKPSRTLATVTSLAKKTPERQWLRDVSAVALQQSVMDAQAAYRNFFSSVSGSRKGARVGSPRRKSKGSRQAARFTRNARFTVEQTTHGVGFVTLPKIGRVRFSLSRLLPSEPSSVTVALNPDGTYEMSFVVDIAAPATVTPTNPGRAAGVDLGLTSFASIVYSDGAHEKIDNPRHLRKRQRKLRNAQKALSRKAGPDRSTGQRASKNYRKQQRKLARVHASVTHARHDFHHQLAGRLIRENQAIAVEKLNVVGLSRSGGKNAQGRGLRRSITDAGWGAFLRILSDKAAEHQRAHVAVNPAGTSRMCSVCERDGGVKPLHVREWTCPDCDARHDRDLNAAVNIMSAAGLAEPLNACGADVRLQLAEADRHEAGTHRTDPILLDAAA